MKYFRSKANEFLGAFGPGITPPEGAIEVAAPPAHAGELWDGAGWDGVIPAPEPDPVLAALELLVAELPVARRAAVQAKIDKAMAGS